MLTLPRLRAGVALFCALGAGVLLAPATALSSGIAAPTTILADSGPSGTVTTRDASFTFTSDQVFATFECRLDPANGVPASNWVACSSGKSYSSLLDGSHTFEVRATSPLGTDDTPATRTWTIDTQPPATLIDPPRPASPSTDRAATLNFHASEPAGFRCQLDSGTWEVCSSPTAYPNLAVGPHTFAVMATDLVGNIEPAPVSWGWTVIKGDDGGSGGGGGGGGGGDGDGGDGGKSDGKRHRHRHHRHKPSRVFVVVMENHEYGSVIGKRGGRYTTRLARRYASAASFYAVAHPSLPNYLAMLSGSTFGVNSGCTDCDGIDARTLIDQLTGRGISWRAYMEGMPRTCYRGPQRGAYVMRHNPFMYFRSITSGRSCRDVVTFDRLRRDLRRGELPTFNWITPNQCHNTHDCSIRRGDRWLSDLIPRLLRHVGDHGFVVLTYDEGTTNEGGGGRIPTIFAGPDVRHGTIRRHYTTYSLLKTFERYFRVGFLREAGARDTLSMDEMFQGGKIPRPKF
jgi:phosphatidylinositol-3-phosphatase